MEAVWTTSKISKLFRFSDRKKSVRSLSAAEEKGEIPKAERVTRGSIQARQWTTEQLPEIGKKFGFISSLPQQLVLNMYVQKGGVLKTTSSYNIARIFALNGLKVIIIGLDPECSITDIIMPLSKYIRLDKTKKSELKGLYHFLYEGTDLSEIIKHSDLPTLDLIPEVTTDLINLNSKIERENRREYIFREKKRTILMNYPFNFVETRVCDYITTSLFFIINWSCF